MLQKEPVRPDGLYEGIGTAADVDEHLGKAGRGGGGRIEGRGRGGDLLRGCAGEGHTPGMCGRLRVRVCGVRGARGCCIARVLGQRRVGLREAAARVGGRGRDPVSKNLVESGEGKSG